MRCFYSNALLLFYFISFTLLINGIHSPLSISVSFKLTLRYRVEPWNSLSITFLFSIRKVYTIFVEKNTVSNSCNFESSCQIFQHLLFKRHIIKCDLFTEHDSAHSMNVLITAFQNLISLHHHSIGHAI